MTLSKREARSRLARLIIGRLRDNAPQGPFGRLADSFYFVPVGEQTLIYSLYYWARYVDRGRKQIRGKNMVYYVDPEDDPRVQSDYARKRGGLRKLTKAEFDRDREAGRLVVTRGVNSIPAQPFILQSVREAKPLARAELRKLFHEDVRSMIQAPRGSDRISIRF